MFPIYPKKWVNVFDYLWGEFYSLNKAGISFPHFTIYYLSEDNKVVVNDDVA